MDVENKPKQEVNVSELQEGTLLELLWPPSGQWQIGTITHNWKNGEVAIRFEDDPFEEPLSYRLESYQFRVLSSAVKKEQQQQPQEQEQPQQQQEKGEREEQQQAQQPAVDDEIEAIMDYVYNDNGEYGESFNLYRVKWKGVPLSESTWEPKEHLSNASEMIERYNAQIAECNDNALNIRNVRRSPFDNNLLHDLWSLLHEAGDADNRYGAVWESEGRAFQVVNVELFEANFLSRNKHPLLSQDHRCDSFSGRMAVLGFEQETASRLYHHPCFNAASPKLIDLVGKNSLPLPDEHDKAALFKSRVLKEKRESTTVAPHHAQQQQRTASIPRTPVPIDQQVMMRTPVLPPAPANVVYDLFVPIESELDLNQCHLWTEHQVAQWIRHLPQWGNYYASKMMQNGVDGRMLLEMADLQLVMTECDVQVMHRATFIHAVNQLRAIRKNDKNFVTSTVLFHTMTTLYVDRNSTVSNICIDADDDDDDDDRFEYDFAGGGQTLKLSAANPMATPITRRMQRRKQRNPKLSQIEIYGIGTVKEDEDQLCKSPIYATAKTVHRKQMEFEADFNDEILHKAKRPFYVLILLAVLFVTVLIMNFVDILQYFVFDGLTPSIVCCSSWLVVFACFKYFERQLKFQHEIIFHKIMESYALKKKLQKEKDEHCANKKYIEDLKLVIAEQNIVINKANNASSSLPNARHSNTLLHGLRRGQMEIQIECAGTMELVGMLSTVVSCITNLPFGMTNYRAKLTRILEHKISANKYLEQHFWFFLLSYVECTDVQRLFRRHKLMKKVKPISEHYYKHRSQRAHAAAAHAHAHDAQQIGESTPHSANTHTAEQTPPNTLYVEKTHARRSGGTLLFQGKDPIKLFRAPLDCDDDVVGPGFTVIVARELQHLFFDPINGRGRVQQLKVRSILNSNARPFLIDCFTAQSAHGGGGDAMSLSSSFILKQGDDLRRDHAVLQMFQLMNAIWKENEIRYRDRHFVSCLIYKCIPIGNDVGIIEMVNNCTELSKIMTLKSTLFTANFCEDERALNKMMSLIASSAGSFIAAFVCGIRDRHDDNILILNDEQTCTLFHIDYGYAFGDTLSLDAARFAITADLKKILELQKNGWSNFVDLAVNAWMMLRQNSAELIDFARVVFALLYEPNEIEMFLRDSLKLDLTADKAQRYMRTKITNAPKQWKTKLKNVVHGLSQKMKASSNDAKISAPNKGANERVVVLEPVARPPKPKKEGFGIGNLNQSGMGGNRVIL